MLAKSPAKSANDGFCQTVWDLTRILISVHCLLTLLAFGFTFPPFSQVIFLYGNFPNGYLRPKISQPLFADHGKSDRKRWWSLAKASFLKQLLNIAECVIYHLKKKKKRERERRRERDASGNRQEADFPRMGGSNERKGRGRKCHLTHPPVFREELKSHQEGVSSFSYSSTNKSPVSLIRCKKKIIA